MHSGAGCDHGFCVGHLDLDMAIGHPCGEGEWARVHVLEVELKIWSG